MIGITAASAAASGGVHMIKKYWWVAFLILFVYIGFKVYQQISKKIEIKNSIKNHEDSYVTEPATGNTVNLKQIAINIYDAFYNRKAWFISWEKEDEAIKNLLKIDKSQVHILAKYYASIEGKSKDLFFDFRKFLRDDQYKKVESILD